MLCCGRNIARDFNLVPRAFSLYPARPVPNALREKIEQDLERLERAGTIEPV